MAYITNTYIDALISTRIRTALFSDGQPPVYSDANCEQARITAHAIVRTALSQAGYTPPTVAELAAMVADAANEQRVVDGENIRLATFGQWLNLGGFVRKQWPIPTELRATLNLVRDIKLGSLTFPTLSLSVPGAVGGNTFSDNDADAGDTLAPMFSKTMGR